FCRGWCGRARRETWKSIRNEPLRKRGCSGGPGYRYSDADGSIARRDQRGRLRILVCPTVSYIDETRHAGEGAAEGKNGLQHSGSAGEPGRRMLPGGGSCVG